MKIETSIISKRSSIYFILYHKLLKVESFVNKVNDWVIKTNSFPIGKFIFILTNDETTGC